LTLALKTGELLLPTGGVSVVLPTPDTDLSAFDPAQVEVVQPFKPYFDVFERAGIACVTKSDTACAAAIICLPRAKAQARAAVFEVCQRCTGLVVVDGSKTDGIDSIYKDVRRRVEVLGQLTKAHGRIFWFLEDPAAFADWQAPDDQKAGEYHTAPGVFSADGVDPASAMLIAALPVKLGRHVVDLGAGWGYLAAELLARNSGIEALDLVEADFVALECARRNVHDPRARFHWADALDWAASGRVDTVVMNPPFHRGRATDPSLGRGFIATAARILAPGGVLWMVANRHLPYEAAMSESFAQVEEISGDNRFKILRASRPKTRNSGRIKPSRTRRPRA
jgi:16S rRNA (guanine1207-N2)-methyltransferase